MPPKAKAKIVKDVTQLVLARRTKMCNFLEYKGMAEYCNPRLSFWTRLAKAPSDTAKQTQRSCTVDMLHCSSSAESDHPTMNL
jgi:hypothetical protein